MDVVKAIVEKTGKKEEEVWGLIEAKRKELDYLISEDGAAHIIASELGINLKASRKVEDLNAGTGGVEVYLRVVRVFPVREFERRGRAGKVRNLVAGDDTGELRVSLWDKQAELELAAGDVIHVSGGYVKDTKAGPELRAGNRAAVEVNPEEAPGELGTKRRGGPEDKKLTDVEHGDLVSLRASLVRVFHRRPFFDSSEGKQLMVSGIVEDETGSMRVIFFRSAAEALLQITREKAIDVAEMSGYAALLERAPMLRPLKLYGRVKHNDMTDTDEIIVNRVLHIDPGEEVDRQLERMMGVT